MQRICFASALAVALFSSTASTHPTIASGPATANLGGQKITIQLAHGCGSSPNPTFDTTKIVVTIPTTVITSVRPLYSDFGVPSITKSGGQVNTITWTKSSATLGSDEAFYEFTFRGRVADVPFTTILLSVQQTCSDGSVVEWDQPTSSPQVGEPAPSLRIVPKRQAQFGWNKFVLTTAVSVADFPNYFGDVQIVWRNSEAFSPNPNTVAQIGATTGVTALASDLAVGDEIWVKY